MKNVSYWLLEIISRLCELAIFDGVRNLPSAQVDHRFLKFFLYPYPYRGKTTYYNYSEELPEIIQIFVAIVCVGSPPVCKHQMGEKQELTQLFPIAGPAYGHDSVLFIKGIGSDLAYGRCSVGHP